MHSCFLSREPRSLYATHWVAPIVSPYKHDGYVGSCAFYSFSDVFPTSLVCEFLPYIMIVTVSEDPYSPDDTDFHLPKAFREFSQCARCGRKAMDDCWAMGAMMEYDNQAVTGNTHLACVYCAAYQAIADYHRSVFDKGICILCVAMRHRRVWQCNLNNCQAHDGKCTYFTCMHDAIPPLTFCKYIFGLF